MATRPCSNRITCPGGGTDADDPLQNWSSEQFDGPDFPSLAWFIGNANNPFFPEIPANGIIDSCDSPISQAEADLCANRGPVIHDTPTPPGGPPPTFFFSAPQSCDFICPDGSVYTFTTEAGAFVSASNQATADAQAHAYACSQAAATHTCLTTLSLSDITPGACVNTFFSQTITISGGQGPYSAAFTGGSLPNGISASEPAPNQIRLSGIPTSVGISPFQITVTDSSGQSVVRNYEIDVLGITNPDLPDGSVGTAYSEQFLGGGGTPPFNMQVLVGTLPDGLTMDSSGLVTGTPTTDGLSSFTVGISDASGNVCEQDCSINVSSCVDWSTMVWDDTSTSGGFGAGASVTAVGANVSGSANGVDFLSSGLGNLHGSTSYTGPGCVSNVVITAASNTPNSSTSIRVVQDGNVVLNLTNATPGTYPFTLIAGVASVIEVGGIVGGGNQFVFGGAGNPGLLIPIGVCNVSFKLMN